jgi:hypothetical protein
MMRIEVRGTSEGEERAMSKSENISIAIVGSGGAGALTTGNFLL